MCNNDYQFSDHTTHIYQRSILDSKHSSHINIANFKLYIGGAKYATCRGRYSKQFMLKSHELSSDSEKWSKNFLQTYNVSLIIMGKEH